MKKSQKKKKKKKKRRLRELLLVWEGRKGRMKNQNGDSQLEFVKQALSLSQTAVFCFVMSESQTLLDFGIGICRLGFGVRGSYLRADFQRVGVSS